MTRTLIVGACLLAAAACGTAAVSSPPVDAPTGARASLDAGVPSCIAPEEDEAQADPNAARPNRIVIPALGVDVRVVPIGLTGGRLVPPSDPQVVGWWKDGAVPGAARGTAILTGHSVSTGGGAFNDLKDLRPGDLITIVTSRGKIGYRVVAVEYYPKKELARLSGVLFSQTVPGRLVLSTCSGFFGGSYHGNTLAFAEPRS